MGAAECSFVATGETNEDVMGKMMEHAKAAHADKMEQMKDISLEEVTSMMMSKIEQ